MGNHMGLFTENTADVTMFGIATTVPVFKVIDLHALGLPKLGIIKGPGLFSFYGVLYDTRDNTQRRDEGEVTNQVIRRQAEERVRQEERRQEEVKAEQEARRQEEERARQEAIARCHKLIHDGVQLFSEGWEAERESNSKLAGVYFQNSYDEFDEACRVNPSNARSVEWRKVCHLKITGNVLFNKGLESQEKGDRESASVLFKESKIAFQAAWTMNGDTGFQECIAIVDKSVEATNEALHEANRGQIQIGDREIRTERGDGQRLVGVVDHSSR